MKLMILTEEDEFYIPLSIDYLLNRFKCEVVEVVCVRNPLVKNKLDAARKFSMAFGYMPVLHQGFRVMLAKIFDKLKIDYRGRSYSVKRVCELHKMKYSYCHNVNSADFVEHCKNLDIDLIVAVSPSQIFKEKIISTPAYGCINIHTAKLPKYRGLYPTFWAMAEGEDKLGISIHYIEKGIDTGMIILQDEIEIPRGTSMSKMLELSKLKGAELMAMAIDMIRNGEGKGFYPESEGSYFSFPTREAYIKFKKNGYKLF